MHQIIVSSHTRSELIDLTAQLQQLVHASGVQRGACSIAVPHTTAGLVVNENWDEDVQADLLEALERLVPWQAGYRHGEGNSAAHIKAALLGAGVTWPIDEGKLALGTWQGIFLAEFDGPRTRHVYITITASSGEE